MKPVKFAWLLRVFCRVHLRRETMAESLDSAWERRVMSAIHDIESDSVQLFLSILIDRWFWRWLPAAALAIVLLCFALALVGVHPEYEMTEMLIQQPVEAPLILSFFG